MNRRVPCRTPNSKYLSYLKCVDTRELPLFVTLIAYVYLDVEGLSTDWLPSQ